MNLPSFPVSMASLNTSTLTPSPWCFHQKGLRGSQSLFHTHSPDRQQDKKTSVQLLGARQDSGRWRKPLIDSPGQIKQSLSRKATEV